MPDVALTAIDKASDRAELFKVLREFYSAQGFDALCYIVPSAGVPGETEMLQFGYPLDWIMKYGEGLGVHDPIVTFSMESGKVFQWSDIAGLRKLGKGNRSFLEELSRSTMTDGLALPTYGRQQHVGYFGIGQVKDEKVLPEADILRLHAVAQKAHSRLDQLSADETPLTALSPREKQIMHWVARGKSNNDLATILGISAATVATHLQRIYSKLDASDRVTAVLVAVKRGLVSI